MRGGIQTRYLTGVPNIQVWTVILSSVNSYWGYGHNGAYAETQHNCIAYIQL